MVDDTVGARQPEQMRDGEAMHHARRFVHLPVRAFVSGLRRERPRVLIQREEAARRIEGGKLEEVEEGAGVVDEPQPVGRQRREAWRPGYGKVSLWSRHLTPRPINEDGGVYRQGGALTRRLRRGEESLLPPPQADRLLGFLGRRQFGRENPSFRGLEKLGFPWILSSESSLFNELYWIFVERNFSRPLLPRRQHSWMQKRRMGHQRSLT